MHLDYITVLLLCQYWHNNCASQNYEQTEVKNALIRALIKNNNWCQFCLIGSTNILVAWSWNTMYKSDQMVKFILCPRKTKSMVKHKNFQPKYYNIVVANEPINIIPLLSWEG